MTITKGEIKLLIKSLINDFESSDFVFRKEKVGIECQELMILDSKNLVLTLFNHTRDKKTWSTASIKYKVNDAKVELVPIKFSNATPYEHDVDFSMFIRHQIELIKESKQELVTQLRNKLLLKYKIR